MRCGSKLEIFYACKRCGCQICGDHKLCGDCVAYESEALKVATQLRKSDLSQFLNSISLLLLAVQVIYLMATK